MIRISTGRRLHFGLFTPMPMPELDLAYGGLGMMVDAPGVVLEGAHSKDWSVQGIEQDRFEQAISMLRDKQPDLLPMHIEVKYLAPSHQGWGSGTQLALALAKLCSVASGQGFSAQQAARCLGRGHRSGIGITGFEVGGFLLDYGKAHLNQSSEVQTCSFPSDWTYVLVEPGQEQGLHADEERRAFSRLQTVDLEMVKQLRLLATEVLVPAASSTHFADFAENLTLYNRLAGSFYHSVQHGDYSSPLIEERLSIMRDHGAIGRGQSSWGPGLFALFTSVAEAEAFRVRCCLKGCQLLLARPMKTGVLVEQTQTCSSPNY